MRWGKAIGAKVGALAEARGCSTCQAGEEEKSFETTRGGPPRAWPGPVGELPKDCDDILGTRAEGYGDILDSLVDVVELERVMDGLLRGLLRRGSCQAGTKAGVLTCLFGIDQEKRKG